MSKIVSNYPRRTGEPTVEEAAALKAAHSGLFGLVFWLPIGIPAWCGIVEELRRLLSSEGNGNISSLLLIIVVLLAGNVMLSKAIGNASIGLGYGDAGRPRLHLLVFFGNLLFLGLGGIVVLHLKLYNVLRSSGNKFMSRRELVNSWSAEADESVVQVAVGRQQEAVTLDVRP